MICFFYLLLYIIVSFLRWILLFKSNSISCIRFLETFGCLPLINTFILVIFVFIKMFKFCGNIQYFLLFPFRNWTLQIWVRVRTWKIFIGIICIFPKHNFLRVIFLIIFEVRIPCRGNLSINLSFKHVTWSRRSLLSLLQRDINWIIKGLSWHQLLVHRWSKCSNTRLIILSCSWEIMLNNMLWVWALLSSSYSLILISKCTCGS